MELMRRLGPYLVWGTLARPEGLHFRLAGRGVGAVCTRVDVRRGRCIACQGLGAAGARIAQACCVARSCHRGMPTQWV